jgi:hypothetical protein
MLTEVVGHNVEDRRKDQYGHEKQPIDLGGGLWQQGYEA